MDFLLKAFTLTLFLLCLNSVEAVYSIGLVKRSILEFFSERTLYDVIMKMNTPMMKEIFDFVKSIKKARTSKGIEKAFLTILLIKHKLCAFHKEFTSNLTSIRFLRLFIYLFIYYYYYYYLCS